MFGKLNQRTKSSLGVVTEYLLSILVWLNGELAKTEFEVMMNPDERLP